MYRIHLCTGFIYVLDSYHIGFDRNHKICCFAHTWSRHQEWSGDCDHVHNATRKYHWHIALYITLTYVTFTNIPFTCITFTCITFTSHYKHLIHIIHIIHHIHIHLPHNHIHNCALWNIHDHNIKWSWSCAHCHKKAMTVLHIPIHHIHMHECTLWNNLTFSHNGETEADHENALLWNITHFKKFDKWFFRKCDVM